MHFDGILIKEQRLLWIQSFFIVKDSLQVICRDFPEKFPEFHIVISTDVRGRNLLNLWETSPDVEVKV
jgi:hypothetical protein